MNVASADLTPLQRGRWAVVGFPPVRGVTSRRSAPPGPIEDAGEPHVLDLIPLLAGGIDSRVDDLKKWLINMHASPRGSALIGSFFRILSDLAPVDQISLGRIDPDNWTVYVKTSDGEVPIEGLSQGMASTIGWVGTLLQRMYEIYPESPNPEHERALVIVDEIDAHLHPAWQRALVGLVTKHFKAVQMIATTHSPLVVAGLRAEDILIAHRDPLEPSLLKVVRASEEADISGMRADQILTSPLF